MSIYRGDTLIAGACAPSRNIGEIVPSMLPLTDAGLHLLDGSLLSGTGVYADFVTYIAGLVSSYPNSFTTEASWQTTVSAYGVCGKFVYDSVNNTVRLPKVTGIIEGTVDVTALGDLVEAGLPNITGSMNFGDGSNGAAIVGQATGAFAQKSAVSNRYAASASTGTSVWGATFAASRSSSLYKNDFNKVQPQTIKAYYYMVVANSIKTSIVADIDQIATDLNLKADTDLANVTNTGTSLVASWSSPSSQYVGLTIGASGASYTAPSDGFVFLSYNITTSSIGYITIEQDGLSDQSVYYGASYQAVYIMRPVHKGLFSIAYGNTSFVDFRFYYLKGNKHEAN